MRFSFVSAFAPIVDHHRHAKSRKKQEKDLMKDVAWAKIQTNFQCLKIQRAQMLARRRQTTSTHFLPPPQKRNHITNPSCHHHLYSSI
jgi:hypothetical protein